jgi:hypothetical protein
MRKTIILIKKIYNKYKYYLDIIKENNPYESITSVQKKINLEVISILDNIELPLDDDLSIINNEI